MLVSVTTQAPFFRAAIPAATAPGEKNRLSRKSKSAVAWMTRSTTGSRSAGGSGPSPSSSPRMISMLRFSISSGRTRCSAI